MSVEDEMFENTLKVLEYICHISFANEKKFCELIMM